MAAGPPSRHSSSWMSVSFVRRWMVAFLMTASSDLGQQSSRRDAPVSSPPMRSRIRAHGGEGPLEVRPQGSRFAQAGSVVPGVAHEEHLLGPEGVRQLQQPVGPGLAQVRRGIRDCGQGEAQHLHGQVPFLRGPPREDRHLDAQGLQLRPGRSGASPAPWSWHSAAARPPGSGVPATWMRSSRSGKPMPSAFRSRSISPRSARARAAGRKAEVVVEAAHPLEGQPVAVVPGLLRSQFLQRPGHGLREAAVGVDHDPVHIQHQQAARRHGPLRAAGGRPGPPRCAAPPPRCRWRPGPRSPRRRPAP